MHLRGMPRTGAIIVRLPAARMSQSCVRACNAGWHACPLHGLTTHVPKETRDSGAGRGAQLLHRQARMWEVRKGTHRSRLLLRESALPHHFLGRPVGSCCISSKQPPACSDWGAASQQLSAVKAGQKHLQLLLAHPPAAAPGGA